MRAPCYAKILICSLVLPLLSACASSGRDRWVQAETLQFSTGTYVVKLPADWLRYQFGRWPGDLYITKHGASLEYIKIIKNRQDQAFPKTRRAIKPSTLTIDLAEMTIIELKRDVDSARLVIEENAPTTIGGQDGFRLRYTLKDDDGLNRRALFYGVLHKGAFYAIIYSAPQLHYFDAYQGDFEQMLTSFRFL